MYSDDPIFVNPYATHSAAKAVFDTLVSLLSWYKLDFGISLLCTHCLQQHLPMEEITYVLC